MVVVTRGTGVVVVEDVLDVLDVLDVEVLEDGVVVDDVDDELLNPSS